MRSSCRLSLDFWGLPLQSIRSASSGFEGCLSVLQPDSPLSMDCFFSLHSLAHHCPRAASLVLTAWPYNFSGLLFESAFPASAVLSACACLPCNCVLVLCPGLRIRSSALVLPKQACLQLACTHTVTPSRQPPQPGGCHANRTTAIPAASCLSQASLEWRASNRQQSISDLFQLCAVGPGHSCKHVITAQQLENWHISYATTAVAAIIGSVQTDGGECR